MTPSARSARGVAAAAGAAVLFGINGTVSKLALEAGLTETRLVQLRSVGAALCLLAAAAVRRPGSLRVERREITFLVVAGIVGIGLVQWLYFVAIARLPVGIALLLEYLAPVLVALWVRFVRHEPVRPRIWAALGALPGGLVRGGPGVVGPHPRRARRARRAWRPRVSLAAYYLTSEHGLGQPRPAEPGGVDVHGGRGVLVGAQTAVDVRLVVSWARAWPCRARSTGTEVPLWSLVAWIVVLGTVIPYGFVLVALGNLGSTRTGLLGMAEPVTSGIVAWVVLDEVAHRRMQLVGAVLVIVGIVFAETSRRDPPEVPPGAGIG